MKLRSPGELAGVGALFTGKEYLKKHIHTIHEGHKDYKCVQRPELAVKKGQFMQNNQE